ncbi:MAG TPA: AAA family ATPase [Thermoguttaceae bacterium]|nr:AAA family ATPase [Thermoguttaceae bacterium]
MSTKDDASLGHPSNGQSLVVHQGAPLGTKDMDWGPVSAYTQGHGTSTTDPSAYFHAIRRHWLAGGLLGIILAAAVSVSVWFALPKHYTAISQIQVSMREPTLLNPNIQYNAQQEYNVFKATQAQLLTSPMVLTAALRKPEIVSLSIYKREEEDPIAWLRDKLHVVFPADAEIMQISLTDREQKEVGKVVNAVIDAYMSEIVESDRNQKARELANLEEVLAGKEREIRQKRTTVKQLADELGTTDKQALQMQLQFATQQLSGYRQELARIQMELRIQSADLEVSNMALKRLDNAPASTLELEQLKLQDPVCRDLEQKRSELQVVIKQAAGKARPGKSDPLTEQLTEQLNGVQAELNARLAYLSDIMTEATRNDLKEKIDDLNVKVSLLRTEEANLKKDVDVQREEFNKLGQSSVDLEMMQTDLDNLQMVVNGVATRKQNLEVETKSPSRILLRQKAEIPPTYDNFQLNASLSVLAGLIGLAFPLTAFVWLDVRKCRINSSEDVVKGLGLPVMGSVPLIPGRAIKQLHAPGKANQHWNLRLAESIDGIAARLLRNAAIDHHRVVLITSAVSGEGKTTLATQIAMSLARAGKHTVLVDFDLRRPAIDKAFQLPLHPGVSEALCGECPVADLPQATGLADLDVVTAGRCDRHALQSLAKGGDKLLFDELREKYEFVIVDGSPILPVADSRYVSQHVDSVVLSVFRDYSRAPKVTAACEILESFGVTDIEAVVTSSASEDGYGIIDTVTPKAAASA